MCTSLTPLKIENLQPVFEKIMKTNQLKSEDVAVNQAKKDIYSTGDFECDCGHTWRSRFSWITFNLIDLRNFKLWKMKCGMCFKECKPDFTDDQLKEMFERAVAIHLKTKSDYTIDIGYGARRHFSRPHLPELCEKCGWGADQCWRILFG